MCSIVRTDVTFVPGSRQKTGTLLLRLGHFRNLGAEIGGTENVFVREYLIALVQAIFLRFRRINSKLKLSGSAQVTRHDDE